MKSDFSAFLFASTKTKDSYRIQQSAIESFYLQLDTIESIAITLGN